MKIVFLGKAVSPSRIVAAALIVSGLVLMTVPTSARRSNAQGRSHILDHAAPVPDVALRTRPRVLDPTPFGPEAA